MPVIVLAMAWAALSAPLYAQSPVPSLDDLAGDWMQVATLRSFPSVNNFWGSLRAYPNLTAFDMLTVPPFANAGTSGSLTVDGQPVRPTESRWYPYQVLRRARVNGVEMESAIRMPFEQRGVMCRLILTNTTSQPRTLAISMQFTGGVRKHRDVEWDRWQMPHGVGGNTIALAGSNSRVLTAVDTAGAIATKGVQQAAVAFAFAQEPAELKAIPDGGIATWKITLAPGQTASLGYTAAIDETAPAAAALASGWAASFDASFAQAKAEWEARWQAAFTPGNSQFSGHFPTLVTGDPKIRRVYYMGAVNPLLLLRTDFPLCPHCYPSAGPIWSVTCEYFWDTEMWANAWAMLEPTVLREQLIKWFSVDRTHCMGIDCISGGGLSDHEYAPDDWSIFRSIEAYIGVTGDTNFLNQSASGKTILEHLDEFATRCEKRPLTKGSLLADFGGPLNLLECSPTYIHSVASLNAADVYMLRRTADYQEEAGNVVRARELRGKAAQLLPAVMALYEPGQGVWNTMDTAGKKVPVRHCYDYFMTAMALEKDLTPRMKSEMNHFVESELLTKTWMRAMSLKDPAAAQSDRPDHGPLGSYDAWPPMTMDAMCRLGDFGGAVAFLRATESVSREGSWSQAHEFLGPDARGNDPIVRTANRGGQDANEICGTGFAEVIIRSFFGFRPDLSGAGKPVLLSPGTPRGFDGELRHVPWHGALYTITSDNRGLRVVKE